MAEIVIDQPVCRARCPACRGFLVPADDPGAYEPLVCPDAGCPAGDRPSRWLGELE